MLAFFIIFFFIFPHRHSNTPPHRINSKSRKPNRFSLFFFVVVVMNKPTLAVLYYLSIPGWSFLFFFFVVYEKNINYFFFFFFFLASCLYVFMLCVFAVCAPLRVKAVAEIVFYLSPSLLFFSFSPFYVG